MTCTRAGLDLALANFFFLPPYSRAYQQIRARGVLDASTREKIEREPAHSLDFVFHFPEWGAHNRAMLRAEGLYYGYRALPDHPHADRWKQMAETLAFDNLHQWEAEDATIYHPIWLNALFSYVTISEQQDLYDSPLLRYYAEYFRQLFTPTRTRLTDDKMGYTWDRIVTYVKPEGVFIVVDAVEVDVEDLLHLHQLLAHAAPPRAGAALLRHVDRLHRVRRTAPRQAVADPFPGQ